MEFLESKRVLMIYLNLVPIFSIRQIVSGNEYRDFIIQHIGLKTFKKSSSSLLAQSGFCIEVNDQTEPFNLTTDDESNVTAWVEGLTCLLNPTNALQMPSIKADVRFKMEFEKHFFKKC